MVRPWPGRNRRGLKASAGDHTRAQGHPEPGRRMTIEIEVGGKRRQVTLRRGDDHWRVEIDGREVAVSVVETGGGRWSMLVGHTDVASGFSRKSYYIAYEPAPGGELIVHVNGIAVPLTVVEQPGSPKPRVKAARGGIAAGSDAGPRAVVAPMPGRIVKVLVQPGEAVQARQGLVVVEAMKMENEVRAPHAGIVADVRVREGSSVEANAVLVVLT